MNLYSESSRIDWQNTVPIRSVTLMESFSYSNPVKVFFGNGVRREIGAKIKGIYKNVLFVCSKGPFRENGMYQEVIANIGSAGVTVHEMPDIDSNPRLSSVREGAAICKRNNIDCIITLGAGSAMDCAKAIGAAAKTDKDPYCFFWGERIPATDSIDTIMIPTIAATGTELNRSAVIVNDETKEKYYFDSIHPKMAFMDPELTVTVPIQLTVWGGMDILSHTFEFYFNGNTRSEFQNRFSESLILTAMYTLERLVENPGDLHARGELMWCAAMTWGTGLTMIGRGAPDMACHGIEESFSGYFDTHHGACLGVLTPRWMERSYPTRPDLFARFARNIFGVYGNDNEAASREGIALYRKWLKQVKAPNVFFDIGKLEFKDEELRRVAKTACRIYGGGVGRMKRYSEEEVYELLRAGKVPY
jgi:alcohol dehydrogenase YqhD (iron-dependent ADH family)